MKSIAWLAVTATMCSSLAVAQEQKPAAKPAATEATKPAATEAAKPAAQEVAKPAETAKPVAQAKKAAGAKKVQRAERRTEDARHCLGRPSNTEIIKCAEAYL
jgi:hypothetical protein